MENNDIKLRKKPIRKGKKPTLVRSPVSNRWIKVGGATWRKLVAQNIIGSGNWVNPNEILSVDPEDFENKNDMLAHLEEQKAVYNTLHSNENDRRAVRRGDNKLVKQRKKLSTLEASQRTADASVNIMGEIREGSLELPVGLSKLETRDYLQGLIYERMIGSVSSGEEWCIENDVGEIKENSMFEPYDEEESEW